MSSDQGGRNLGSIPFAMDAAVFACGSRLIALNDVATLFVAKTSLTAFVVIVNRWLVGVWFGTNMARGDVSDTFLTGACSSGSSQSNVDAELSAIFGDESSKSEAASPPPRFGHVVQIIAAHPAAEAVREDAAALLQHVYKAAAVAASTVQKAAGANASLALDDRLSNLERLFAQLTCTNGTIDHIFGNINELQQGFVQLREELDCRTAPEPGELSSDTAGAQLGTCVSDGRQVSTPRPRT